MLAIDELIPHPDNPRLQLREDVIERIAAEISRSGFGQEHALLVRPVGAGCQILSGHHRVEAAKRAGLADVPCWVKELDDDEAFMQLVLANTQGELSPLEHGIHALGASDRWHSSGRSLSAYADRIGVTGAYIGQLRNAALVLSKIRNHKPEFNTLDLGDKAKHLYEISKAPTDTQILLVGQMLSHDWTVADTKHHVDQVREFSIPDEWSFWLPLDLVVGKHLSGREFSPRTVTRLISAAEQTMTWIDANGAEMDRAEFREWLAAGIDGKSWEPRAVAEYLSRLIASQFIVAGWHHGDWRDYLHTLDDGTVTLVLTDPPYGQGFQSDYRLDRRTEHKHGPIAADDETAAYELLTALTALHPKLATDAHLLVFCGWAGEPEMRQVVEKAGYTIRGSLIWDKQATGMGDPETTFAPAHERILHAVKGSPLLFRRAPDLLSHRRCDSSRHPTEKPVPLLRELIEATTAEGQLVADPFGGVASTLHAARDAGRRWWGCEISETYWRAGEERLS